MASTDWHSDLSFSNRLTEVSKITSASLEFAPSISTTEARRAATVIETEIYDEASSVEDYHRRCADRIQELLENVPKPFPLEQDPEPVPEPSGIDIGQYKNAVYHREGLFSVVYKAVAHDNGKEFSLDAGTQDRLVALKVTTPSMMQPPHDSKREAQILALAASERVIPLVETFREAGTRFVIVFPFMPFEFDQSLHEQKLSKVQIRQCLKDMFSALVFIHSHGIIHRDIKPANILLKSLDGPAYLSDFGISWAPEAPGSEAADNKITDVGTTCYRPPELLFGNKKYGCSLDLWAAGCTVAEAVVAGHSTLFDSGELGSDLALIHSIFTKLGTPDLTDWPEAVHLPDWGKMQFKDYPRQSWSALLPNTSDDERDIVSRLVQYESGARVTAEQALRHPYFNT